MRRLKYKTGFKNLQCQKLTFLTPWSFKDFQQQILQKLKEIIGHHRLFFLL